MPSECTSGWVKEACTISGGSSQCNGVPFYTDVSQQCEPGDSFLTETYMRDLNKNGAIYALLCCNIEQGCPTGGYYDSRPCSEFSRYPTFDDCWDKYQSMGNACNSSGNTPSSNAGACDVESWMACCEYCTRYQSSSSSSSSSSGGGSSSSSGGGSNCEYVYYDGHEKKYNCRCYNDPSAGWCHTADVDIECWDDSGNIVATRTTNSSHGCRYSEEKCLEDNCSDEGVWIEGSNLCSVQVCD